MKRPARVLLVSYYYGLPSPESPATRGRGHITEVAQYSKSAHQTSARDGVYPPHLFIFFDEKKPLLTNLVMYQMKLLCKNVLELTIPCGTVDTLRKELKGRNKSIIYRRK